jgi:hypothetical protein
MGSIDASCPCGSNAGQCIGIGGFVVEIIYAYYFCVDQSGGRLGGGGHSICFEFGGEIISGASHTLKLLLG